MKGKRAGFFILCVLCIVVFSTCDDRSSILLIINGDLRPGLDVEGISIRISTDSEEVALIEHDMTGEAALPQSLRIWAGEDITRSVDVEISANSDDDEVLSVSRRFHFIVKAHVDHRVCLLRECIGSDDEDCLTGMCPSTGPDGDADVDCDGPGRDRDQDGFVHESCGGDDCDDSNPLVNPDRAEFCRNDIDDDCDGDVDESGCDDGDSCEERLVFDAPSTITGDTSSLSDEYSGDRDYNSADFVSSFYLTETSSVRISTEGSSFDTYVFVRSGDCQSNGETYGNDDSAAYPNSRIDLFELPRGEYFVFVEGDESDEEGDFQLEIAWAGSGCGNGFQERGEECDDGNAVDSDSCSNDCERNHSCMLRFDGDDDSVVVDIDPFLDLEAGFTFEVWFRTDGRPDGDMAPLFRKGRADSSLFMWVMDNHVFQVGVYNDEGDPFIEESTTIADDGRWHHGAMTFDGRTVVLFLDGVEEGSTRIDEGGLYMTDRPLTIGSCRRDGRESSFYGEIDEVRISSEVLYTENFTPSRRLNATSSTVALYHFDECGGVTARSDSGADPVALVNNVDWIPQE